MTRGPTQESTTQRPIIRTAVESGHTKSPPLFPYRFDAAGKSASEQQRKSTHPTFPKVLPFGKYISAALVFRFRPSLCAQPFSRNFFQGDSWAHLAEFVDGMGCLRELGVCIQDDENPPPVDLEDFVSLCPGLRTLGIGPDLWERLAQGNQRRGRSRWNDLSQARRVRYSLFVTVEATAALIVDAQRR